MRQSFWLVVVIAIASASSIITLSYVHTGSLASDTTAGAPEPSSNLEDLAARLSLLYHSALEDDEMRSHLPVKMQRGMGLGSFTYGQDCFFVCPDVLTYDAGWDHESYRGSMGLNTDDYCLRAHEVLTGGVEWMPRGAFWLEFRNLCSRMHSLDALESFARLPEAISDECKSKISEGWVVNRDGLFYRPSHADGLNGLDAGEDEHHMAFIGCVPVGQEGWPVFIPRYQKSTTPEWRPVHPLPLDDVGEVAPGRAHWAEAAEAPSIREAALDDDELRSRLPPDVQMAMGAEPFAYQSYDCSGSACSMTERLEHGWDHESYLRSNGLDTYDYCLAAHAKFVEMVGWLPRGAYWDRFMYVCEHVHSDGALEAFGRLPGLISDDCASNFSNGQFVDKDGLLSRLSSFYRPDGQPYSAYIRPAFDAGGYLVWFEDCLVHGSEDTLEFFQPRPYTYEWTHKDIEASPLAEGDPGITKRDLAAELASLYTMAAEDDGLRSLLPADIRETMTSTPALAERLSSLYHSALEDDEMRSHLPEKMQRAMGTERFVYYPVDCFNNCPSIMRLDYGWDHESYLLSQNLDRSDYCLRAHKTFTDGIEWLPQDAFWPEFWVACKNLHSSDVLRHFARLPEYIPGDCKSRIDDGWVVNTKGPHETLTLPGTPRNSDIDYEHSMDWGSCAPGFSNDLFWGASYIVHNYDVPEWRPPPPLPTDDLAEAQAAGDPALIKRALADELASLYAMAAEDDGLRSLLPADIRESLQGRDAA